MSNQPENNALTVTQAMRLAKGQLNSVWVNVIGEVSELSNKPGYSGVFFSLRDQDATMPCVIWKSNYARMGFDLAPGMLIEAYGNFDVYPAKGRMQFNVLNMKPAGEGALRVKVAMLARKLEAEGLMDPARKLPLPRIPQTIAIVTSPRDKAVHDCLRTLRRRWPLAHILFCGIPVEGTDAVRYISQGVSCAIQARPDVILLVRGGGSYEDYMPFNDESLVRLVASSPVPIVTGIGHEPDNSICDMVASYRASTPTAAAEAVAPNVSEVIQGLDGSLQRLERGLLGRLRTSELQLDAISKRRAFQDPSAPIQRRAKELDSYALRLSHAIPDSFNRDARRVELMQQKLMSTGPRILQKHEQRLGMKAASLESLSPLAVLSRGYGMARKHPQGGLVTSVSQVEPGQDIDLQLKDGRLICSVRELERND